MARAAGAGLLAVALGVVGCDQVRSTESVVGTTTGAAPTDDETADADEGPRFDLPVNSSVGCLASNACDLIDLLFVIDNSGTMGEEQLNLAANLPLLVEQLQNLRDDQGNKVNPNVNIMVTSTDFGHPLCSRHQAPGYAPAQGAPVYQGCNGRIERFTSIDGRTSVPEACTEHCPADIAPGDPFIHFSIDGTNVPGDDVAAALSCIGPQGLDGCGYEAPLESMLQAINPDACWNDPQQEACADTAAWNGVRRGFLRDDAVLAIAIITDEADCSVAGPDGFAFFTDDDRFWSENPSIEAKQATSAICANASVSCDDVDGNGVYESCQTVDEGVLQPTERYVSYLHHLTEDLGKDVIMLGILGVPEVTAHNERVPFQPTEGGIFDLEYRDWRSGAYPEGDILPAEYGAGVDADAKRFEFGPIGPGCTGQSEQGTFTGQAIAPVRIREVCESLNYIDADGAEQVRCCMESICDDDFSPAIRCLTGIIQETIAVTG